MQGTKHNAKLLQDCKSFSPQVKDFNLFPRGKIAKLFPTEKFVKLFPLLVIKI